MDAYGEQSGGRPPSRSGQAVLKLLGSLPKSSLTLGGANNRDGSKGQKGGAAPSGGIRVPGKGPSPANPFAGTMGGYSAGSGANAATPKGGWLGSGSVIGGGDGSNGSKGGSKGGGAKAQDPWAEWQEPQNSQVASWAEPQDSWNEWPEVQQAPGGIPGGMPQAWNEWPEVQNAAGGMAGGMQETWDEWSPMSGGPLGLPAGVGGLQLPVGGTIGVDMPSGDVPVGAKIGGSDMPMAGNLLMAPAVVPHVAAMPQGAAISIPTGGGSLPPGVPIGGKGPSRMPQEHQAATGSKLPVPHAPGSAEFRAIFPEGEVHDAMAANPMMAALTGPVAASCSDVPVPGGPCALELLQEATIDPTKASGLINELLGLGSCNESDVQAAALKLTMKQCYAFSTELAKAMGYHSLEHYELHKQALVKAQTRGSKKFGNDDGKRLTLFVGGLRRETDDEKLKQHFSKYGHVAKADVIRSSDGHSRGFAFVKFSTEEGIQNAIENKFEHILDGQWVNTKISDPNRADAGKNASRAVELAAANAGVDPAHYLDHLSKKAEAKYGFGSSLEESDPFQRSNPY